MFVHLHNHTEYSLLDGMSKMSSMVAKVVELGQNAVAVTDHGNLHGALEFYRSARSAGICLLYTSPSPRDRTRSRMPSSA